MVEVESEPRTIDWTACSAVEVNPQKLSGTQVLKGTRMQADSILENFRSGLTASEIADVFEQKLSGVRQLLEFASPVHPAHSR